MKRHDDFFSKEIERQPLWADKHHELAERDHRQDLLYHPKTQEERLRRIEEDIREIERLRAEDP